MIAKSFIKYLKKANILIDDRLILQKSSFNVFLKIYYCCDIFLSYLIYGSSVEDYFTYEFFNRNYYSKKTFVTYRKAQKIFRHFLSPEYRGAIGDKKQINGFYNEYLKRDWLYIKDCDFEEFCNFLAKHKKIIVKPHYGTFGRNIYVLKVNENNIYEEFMKLKEQDVIIEEYITQHPLMASLHQESVNTIRITTVCSSNQVVIMNAFLKIGNKGMEVDNRAAGGIMGAINIEEGIVFMQGKDKYLNEYIYHPVTKKVIPGFHIPLWDEVIDFVKEMALLTPSARYGGWDIAITEAGPVLVEVNYQGGMTVQQENTQKGLWSKYKELLKG